jgi:hypothetical protein
MLPVPAISVKESRKASNYTKNILKEAGAPGRTETIGRSKY